MPKSAAGFHGPYGMVNSFKEWGPEYIALMTVYEGPKLRRGISVTTAVAAADYPSLQGEEGTHVEGMDSDGPHVEMSVTYNEQSLESPPRSRNVAGLPDWTRAV